MAFLTIPISNQLPWQKFKTTLSGTIFTLEFRYNTRDNRWIMDILDPSENPILVGIPCLINRNLTGQYSYLSVPIGTIFATDDTGQQTQPTEFSFGIDHTLWYFDPTT